MSSHTADYAVLAAKLVEIDAARTEKKLDLRSFPTFPNSVESCSGMMDKPMADFGWSVYQDATLKTCYVSSQYYRNRLLHQCGRQICVLASSRRPSRVLGCYQLGSSCSGCS